MAEAFPLEQYLQRIGIKQRPKANLEGLRELHAAQVRAIPFEGLDPFLGRPVSLAMGDICGKLLGSKRGGYCFELNLLFRAALQNLGFTVSGHTGRVRWRDDPASPLGPRIHMVLAVELAEGTYLADAGFAGCMLDEPLLLRETSTQPTTMADYQIQTRDDGHLDLRVMQPNGWRTAYVFDRTPQQEADFQLGNWYTSTSPNVPFKHRVIVEKLAGSKRCKLINRRFTTEGRNGKVESERLLQSPAELEAVLSETFGIAPPISAEALWGLVQQREQAQLAQDQNWQEGLA